MSLYSDNKFKNINYKSDNLICTHMVLEPSYCQFTNLFLYSKLKLSISTALLGSANKHAQPYLILFLMKRYCGYSLFV